MYAVLGTTMLPMVLLSKLASSQVCGISAGGTSCGHIAVFVWDILVCIIQTARIHNSKVQMQLGLTAHHMKGMQGSLGLRRSWQVLFKEQWGRMVKLDICFVMWVGKQLGQISM